MLRPTATIRDSKSVCVMLAAMIGMAGRSVGMPVLARSFRQVTAVDACVFAARCV